LILLPPIGNAAPRLERDRNRMKIVAGAKKGSTFLHVEILELGARGHCEAVVGFLQPQPFTSIDAWKRLYGYGGEIHVYRWFVGGPEGGPGK
jgi:hypothetical protein